MYGALPGLAANPCLPVDGLSGDTPAACRSSRRQRRRCTVVCAHTSDDVCGELVGGRVSCRRNSSLPGVGRIRVLRAQQELFVMPRPPTSTSLPLICGTCCLFVNFRYILELGV